jgi:hypothetical protein
MTKTEREMIALDIEIDIQKFRDTMKLWDITADENFLSLSLLIAVLTRNIERLESLHSEKEEIL